MVLIKKRRTPEDVICEAVAPNWRDAFRHPVIGSFARDPYGLWNQNTEAAHILHIASLCKRGTLLQTPMQEKVFVYLLCFVLWRVFGKSILTDPEYAALARHLWGGVILDKIDRGGAVPLAHRMAFIFDVPQYGRMYRKAGTMPLPPPKVKAAAASTSEKPRLRRVKPKK